VHVDPPVVRIQPGRPRVVRTRGAQKSIQDKEGWGYYEMFQL